MSRVSSKMAMI
jgi:hypothetical protein